MEIIINLAFIRAVKYPKSYLHIWNYIYLPCNRKRIDEVN